MQSHVDFAYPWYLTIPWRQRIPDRGAGHTASYALFPGPQAAAWVNGGAVGQNRLRSPGYECVKHVGGARAAAHIVLRKRA